MLMYAVYENKAREYKVFIAKIQHYQKDGSVSFRYSICKRKGKGAILESNMIFKNEKLAQYKLDELADRKEWPMVGSNSRLPIYDFNPCYHKARKQGLKNF